MAEYIALTEKGKAFIRSKCSGTGNSLLYGNPKVYLDFSRIDFFCFRKLQ